MVFSNIFIHIHCMDSVINGVFYKRLNHVDNNGNKIQYKYSYIESAKNNQVIKCDECGKQLLKD